MSAARSACDFTRPDHTTPPIGAPKLAAQALACSEVVSRTTSVILWTQGNITVGLARTTAVREKRYMLRPFDRGGPKPFQRRASRRGM